MTKIAPQKAEKSKRLWQEMERYVPKAPYHYTDVIAESASGTTVTDVDGKTYIDFTGGIGVLNVGHNHPKVVKAVTEQAKKLIHTSFHVCAYENYIQVCKKLTEFAPGKFPKKAILFNSGAEAVENAIKAAKIFTKRQGVLSFDMGFHGRTWMAVSLTGKEKPYRTGLHPFMADVYHSPYPYPYRPPVGVDAKQLTAYCLQHLEDVLNIQTAPESVAAIIVEAVQGEGGFVVPTPDFLPGVRKICDKYGIVMILDEVQSGFGRTGKMFATDNFGVVPDLMTVAKSLGAGMPLSGVVGRADILDAAEVGAMGGTYGGNPLSCAAALAVFEIFEEQNLVARSNAIGKRIAERFDGFRDQFDFVGDSRGLGAMRAIELVKDKKTKEPIPEADTKHMIHDCQDQGLLILKAGLYNNVIRTLIPLVATDAEVDKGLDIIENVLKAYKK